MTYTTQVEWHADRPLVHFGSPQGTAYWTENGQPRTLLLPNGAT